ncbi:MAG: hypothetical protein ACOX5Q_09720 [Bacillota bacterium]|jgi:hypothetical protein|nr:hypothetical protein [Candidatus Fermentithermobacillaceae bacterium]
MSQRERPKEADLEQDFKTSFREYEEWRTAQAEEEAPTESPERQEKRKGFGKMDLIFIVLGVLAGLVYQACKSSG